MHDRVALEKREMQESERKRQVMTSKNWAASTGNRFYLYIYKWFNFLHVLK